MPVRQLFDNGKNPKSALVAALLSSANNTTIEGKMVTAIGDGLMVDGKSGAVVYRDGTFYAGSNGSVVATFERGLLKDRDTCPVIAELRNNGQLYWRNGQGSSLPEYLIKRVRGL